MDVRLLCIQIVLDYVGQKEQDSPIFVGLLSYLEKGHRQPRNAVAAGAARGRGELLASPCVSIRDILLCRVSHARSGASLGVEESGCSPGNESAPFTSCSSFRRLPPVHL